MHAAKTLYYHVIVAAQTDTCLLTSETLQLSLLLALYCVGQYHGSIHLGAVRINLDCVNNFVWCIREQK